MRLPWCRETGGKWVNEEGVRPAVPGFCVRCGCESEDSRDPGEHVVYNRRILRDEDQTPEERAFLILLRCQGPTWATKDQGRRYLDLVVTFLLGKWKWVHQRLLRKVLEISRRWTQFGQILRSRASATVQKRRTSESTEQVMRRTYIEATREMKCDLQRRKEAFRGLGRSSGHRRLGRTCSEFVPLQGCWNGGSAPVDYGSSM